jgi:hypothetical protein
VDACSYELMNEPFGGDVWKDPLLWVPPFADAETLQPVFDTLATAIREVDRNHLIFFESEVRHMRGCVFVRECACASACVRVCACVHACL